MSWDTLLVIAIGLWALIFVMRRYLHWPSRKKALPTVLKCCTAGDGVSAVRKTRKK